ncbi:MAG TPA: amino acid carrier protein, partial [Lacipirellulaceae bacterium]|nr:amino acid carrier protein [Lacipirellulaceae bacterium]
KNLRRNRLMDAVAQFIEYAADEFAPYLIWTIMATALFFTIRFRFVQFTRFREAVRETIASRQTGSNGALSPLQAFMTALAATIGTGNIAGVATAIVSGGPGALFWIWCYGILAMATKFAEASLGVHFRVAHGEQVLSGPMYYLRDGLKSRALAGIFAFLAGTGVLFTTPLTQPNSVAVVLKSEFNLQPWLIGVVLAVLTWLVIVHGIKSIGRAAEKLSPLKVGLYLAGGLVVIVTHITEVPQVLAMVFHGAFTKHAATGGAIGFSVMTAIRYGVARGVYANEAGYGTAAVAYGTAKSLRPEQQGLAAMMDVFIITFITSSISALTILLTGVWQLAPVHTSLAATGAATMPGGNAISSVAALSSLTTAARESGATSSAVVAEAFNTSIPTFGGWMVAISVFLFGYTVLIGWCYYGEQYFEYLFGPRIITPFRWLYCLLIPLGAVAKVNAVWAWGDIFNGLQVFPNVIGLIGLSGIAAIYARSRRRDENDLS